jgi:hypothetical protein
MTDDQARPGFARIDATDTPADIARKMRVAFRPVAAMREGYARATDPHHRARDIDTGRFVRRTTT